MEAKINAEIKALHLQISKLEDQLTKHREKEQEVSDYEVKGRRAIFADTVKQTHKENRTGVIDYMKKLSWKTYLTGSIVYFMIIPFAFLDLSVTIFQKICFWAWEVPKVHRSTFVFIDRHHLEYLNGIEKLYCIFCGYANGVIGFTREVAARTEKFWCPIKHATKVVHAHEHYSDYLDYGDASGWLTKDDNRDKDEG